MDNELLTKLNGIETSLKEVKMDLGLHKADSQESFKEMKSELSEIKLKVNETYTAVDGFIKIVDRLEDEFTAMKEDLNRVKKVIREKLGVEL